MKGCHSNKRPWSSLHCLVTQILQWVTDFIWAGCTVCALLSLLLVVVARSRLPYSRKFSQGLNFTFFAFCLNWRKFIHKVFSFAKHSVMYCSIVTGSACNHGPTEVFSVQLRSLSDPKRLLSSTVRSQAIDIANKNVSTTLYLIPQAPPWTDGSGCSVCDEVKE